MKVYEAFLKRLMSKVFELNPAVTKHKKRVAAKSFQVTTKNVASLPSFNL